jgi:hypothetical protein
MLRVVVIEDEHTPGAKAPFSFLVDRPKAEALGYLDAKHSNTTLKANVKGRNKSKAKAEKKQKQTQILRLRRRMTTKNKDKATTTTTETTRRFSK